MCGRLTLPSWDEMMAIARQLGARMPDNPVPDWPAQVRPGAQLPLFAWSAPASGNGGASTADAQGPGESIAPLALTLPTWGYLAPWNNKLVYNTRIESADSAMWAASFAHGRAVVAAASFFEPHQTETQRNPSTGRMGKRSYAFTRPDGAPLMLGAVHQNGRASIVTTEPNEHVAPIHPRMPLVLGPEEVGTWLGADWHTLADRSKVELASAPEFEDSEPQQLSFF